MYCKSFIINHEVRVSTFVQIAFESVEYASS